MDQNPAKQVQEIGVTLDRSTSTVRLNPFDVDSEEEEVSTGKLNPFEESSEQDEIPVRTKNPFDEVESDPEEPSHNPFDSEFKETQLNPFDQSSDDSFSKLPSAAEQKQIGVNPFDVSNNDVTPEEVCEPVVNVLGPGETRQQLEIMQEENQLRETTNTYKTNVEGNFGIPNIIGRMESDVESVK